MYRLKMDASVSDTVVQVLLALEHGRSAIVSTGRGQLDGGDRLGKALGRILREVVQSCSVPRVAVVGGDTSGQVAREIGIEALEYIGPLEPGSPLCRARSGDPAVDGLEITFKGGQVGHDDFFATLLRGRSSDKLGLAHAEARRTQREDVVRVIHEFCGWTIRGGFVVDGGDC